MVDAIVEPATATCNCCNCRLNATSSARRPSSTPSVTLAEAIGDALRGGEGTCATREGEGGDIIGVDTGAGAEDVMGSMAALGEGDERGRAGIELGTDCPCI